MCSYSDLSKYHPALHNYKCKWQRAYAYKSKTDLYLFNLMGKIYRCGDNGHGMVASLRPILRQY